jgi:hypothetical protein
MIFLLDFQAARWTMARDLPQQVGNNHPTRESVLQPPKRAATLLSRCLRTGSPTTPYHQVVARRNHPALVGAHAMPKERTQQKEAKNKSALTPKEKEAAKRSKKEGKLAASA